MLWFWWGDSKLRLEWWKGGCVLQPHVGSQNSVLETQSSRLPFERARGLVDGTQMKSFPCNFIINIIITSLLYAS